MFLALPVIVIATLVKFGLAQDIVFAAIIIVKVALSEDAISVVDLPLEVIAMIRRRRNLYAVAGKT